MKSSNHYFVLEFIIIVLVSFVMCRGALDNTGEKPDEEQTVLLNEFFILAYSGPPPEQMNLPRYREIANAGIDIIIPGGMFTTIDNLKAMKLAQQVGIKVLPWDNRIGPMVMSPNAPIDISAIKAVVSDYKDNPALAGYIIRDEPNGKMFPKLIKVCNIFRQEDPNHEPLINLFPSYATREQLGASDFRTYVHDFIATVKPGIVSYDHYPLRGKRGVATDWYGDLEIVRDETRNVGIPFMIFIQSEGIGASLRVPDRAEVFWQANTALAYGARGIGWFCYWTPVSATEQHHDAMININGNRTPLYDYVREENSFLRNAGRALIGWDNTDVARYRDGKLFKGASPVISPVGKGIDLVIGTFTQGQKHRLVIANGSFEKSTTFALTLAAKWHIGKVIASLDAKPKNELSLRGSWTLLPGGCLVLELEL